jgi:serine-type D-Ala-D-Ala carboxypeptidase/endopeptidase (penicillin-binding protein 4)
MMYSMRLLLILVLVICPSGCIRREPVPFPAASAAAGPVKILRADLDKIFSDQRFARAQLGVEVFSLDHSEILYELNSQRFFVPASSNKVITTAVALIRLGPDYRFETRVLADGKIENGVLDGHLIIMGSGDPANSPKFQAGDGFATFRSWASILKQKGIRSISGSILGDDGAFTEPGLGFGWEWNDLCQAYAAPAGALQFNDNILALEILPGAEEGSPASIRTFPLEGYLQINNLVTTGAESIPAEIRAEHGDFYETINAFGTIPAKGAAVLQTVAVRRPTYYYLTALSRTLAREGIHTDDCEIKQTKAFHGQTASVLLTQASPELSALIKVLMKDSVNLYAETLVRTLGLKLRGEGSFAKGKEVVEETLSQMGIAAGSYSYADGSGLSRLNLVSADTLVRVLRYIYKDRSFEKFYDALPIAGVDGTLSERMKWTKAANNVHAKTGTMTNVSSISGYMKTADGEMLAFCIAVNNHSEPKSSVESIQDKALDRLAGFSREQR